MCIRDRDKVVGLVTIKPKSKTSYFKKNIHTILANATFVRRGSNTIPVSYTHLDVYKRQTFSSINSIFYKSQLSSKF